MRSGRHGVAVGSVLAMVWTGLVATPAVGCDAPLSRLFHAALKPQIEAAALCRDIPEIDQTHSVLLKALDYCPGGLTSTLDATLTVECRTSTKALLPWGAQETFDIGAEIGSRDCRITEFSVRPRGAAAGALTKMLGLESDIRRSFQDELTRLCN